MKYTYIVKKQIAELNKMAYEQKLLEEGITIADMRPIILTITQLTKELLDLYPDSSQAQDLEDALTAIECREILDESGNKPAVFLNKLVRGDEDYIATIENELFTKKITSLENTEKATSGNLNDLYSKYILSVKTIALKHIQHISTINRQEMKAEQRKRIGPSFFKHHDRLMAFYRSLKPEGSHLIEEKEQPANVSNGQAAENLQADKTNSQEEKEQITNNTTSPSI